MTKAAALSAARFWCDRSRPAVLAGVFALAGIAALAGSAYSTPTLPGFDTAEQHPAPPAAPPLLVRQLAPDQAVTVNSEIPLDTGPNPAAQPFILGKVDDTTRTRALDCLTSAIYYEAGSEDADGQRAVAQVVLNRVRHPAFPASVCGVVYDGSTRATGCQFTFTCDGSLLRPPSPDVWNRARTIAAAALSGFVYKPVGTATHYHADYVVPYWASTLTKNAIVGAHIFYRWAGSWGRPMAFTQSYGRSEPNADSLKAAAILAERRDEATRNSPSTAQAISEIPGAEALPLAPSMRGDKRVAVRFNLVARTASNSVKHEDYVEKVHASETLRWSLEGDGSANEKALGRSAETTTAASDGAAAQ